MGVRPPGLRLSCHNVIPHARGLGSSSAAIVAGVTLARGLVAGGSLLMDDDALFDLAARLEGHPDNVAPAFYGGFAISGCDDAGFYAVRSAVDPRVGAVVFVPPTPVSTEVARGLLPGDVPHADAAANAGRAALLVAALAGQPEQLLRATRDYLHQDYRRAAMPELPGAGRRAARRRARRRGVRGRADRAGVRRRPGQRVERAGRGARAVSRRVAGAPPRGRPGRDPDRLRLARSENVPRATSGSPRWYGGDASDIST